LFIGFVLILTCANSQIKCSQTPLSFSITEGRENP
jgi:hypothetical protein